MTTDTDRQGLLESGNAANPAGSSLDDRTVDLAYLGLCWAFAGLWLLEAIVGPSDWIPQVTELLLLPVGIYVLFPIVPRAIITFVLGLVGVAMHMSYYNEWLGILFLLVAVPLTVLSVVRIVNQCRQPTGKGADAWLPMKESMPGFCGTDICRWLTCGLVSILLAWSVFVALALFLTESSCVIQSYSVDQVLQQANGGEPALLMGTDENIDVPPPLNFTGIWWINFQMDPIPFYRQYHVEELVTFEGTTSKSVHAGENFPSYVAAPSGTARHWGFTNTIVSRIGMVIVANTADPEGPMEMDFSNATTARIRNDNSTIWWLRAVDSDRWLREIERPGLETWYYNLDRVILPSGQAQPDHWPAFKASMGRTKIRVWTTTSKCMRMCAVKPWRTCGSCSSECGE